MFECAAAELCGSNEAEILAVGRPRDEFLGERLEIKPMLEFELRLADLMLLKVVIVTKAYAPFVRGFETEAPIGARTDVRAFDR